MAQTDRHTHIQTDGHGDSITNSAQRGRVGENHIKQKIKILVGNVFQLFSSMFYCSCLFQFGWLLRAERIVPGRTKHSLGMFKCQVHQEVRPEQQPHNSAAGKKVSS